MCEVLDRTIEKGEVIGIRKGENKKLVEQVQKKLNKGKSIPVIADELEESINMGRVPRLTFHFVRRG